MGAAEIVVVVPTGREKLGVFGRAVVVEVGEMGLVSIA